MAGFAFGPVARVSHRKGGHSGNSCRLLCLFNKPVAVGAAGSPLPKAMPELAELTLSHEQSMERGGPPGRAATYALSPGDCVFRLKAANDDAIWNEKGSELRIRVKQPWWGTW